MFLEAVDSFRLTRAVQACTTERLARCLAAAPTACVAAHLSEAAAVAAALGCVLGYVGGVLCPTACPGPAWVVRRVVDEDVADDCHAAGVVVPSALLTAMRAAPEDGRVALLASAAAVALVRSAGDDASVRCAAFAARLLRTPVEPTCSVCINQLHTGGWCACCMHSDKDCRCP